jgi:hypothetical protein
VKSKGLVEETVGQPSLREELWITTTAMRVEAEIVEPILVKSPSQPVSARQSPSEWYQNQPPIHVQLDSLRLLPPSARRVAVGLAEIAACLT